MIRVDVEQRTEAWLQARIGVVTASNCDRIMTPKTMKPSASATKYAYEILAEEILGQPLDGASSGFMERGAEMEAEARAWYEFTYDVDLEGVGFCLRDDRRVGCSPDSLVGEAGMIEIKCPSAAVHLGYLLGDAGAEYMCQMMCSLLVTGRQWIDFVSYCPGLPPVCVRFTRDEAFIAKLDEYINAFLVQLDGHRATLRELGALPDLDQHLAEAA